MSRKNKTRTTAISNDPPDYADESDISRFDNMKVFAYAGIFVVFGVAISLNDFKSMWTPPPDDRAIYIARVALFGVLVILAIRFVIATHHELRLWIRWLKNPVEKQEVYASFFCLALILGLSLAFPHRIVFLSGFLTTAFLFLYWAQWLANDHLYRALVTTRRNHVSAAKKKALDAMEFYWLQRPQMARLTTMLYVSSISFAFAFAGAIQPGPMSRSLSLAAYWILTANIAGGEIVVAWWRHRLESELRNAVSLAH